MWAILRNQNSYNSGLWTDMRFTSQENQSKVLLPLNPITEKIWYTNDDTTNMRVLVSAYTDHPIAWKISKCEDANPKGIKTITLYQDFFNQHRDYIEKDETGKIIGMWADYYDNTPISEPSFSIDPKPDVINEHGEITSSTSSIKIGGSYKNLSLKIYDHENNDITSEYSNNIFNWSCFVIDGNTKIDLTQKVNWLNGKEFNQKKIKFINDRSYLGKQLEIKCTVHGIEATKRFELIV